MWIYISTNIWIWIIHIHTYIYIYIYTYFLDFIYIHSSQDIIIGMFGLEKLFCKILNTETIEDRTLGDNKI